jgi:CRISPR/Cas system CSM-associated protein Csm5 (group 7 of RAMP superfamily)
MQKIQLEFALKNEKTAEERRINLNSNLIPDSIVQKSSEEIYEDINAQEKILKDNLVKLGFV